MGGWGLIQWTHAGSPDASLTTRRPEESRSAFLSKGVRYLLHLGSLTVLPALGDPTQDPVGAGALSSRRIYSIAFSWNKPRAPERRAAGEAGPAPSLRGVPMATGPRVRDATPRAPKLCSLWSVCAALSPPHPDFFFIVCNWESVYNLIF